MTSRPVAATEDAYALGESPIWDPIRWGLIWVDITTGRAFVGSLLEDGTIAVVDTVDLPGETLSAVAVTLAGDWIMAGRERMFLRRPDTTICEGPRVLPADSGRRLNDGKPDPMGRYLIGTLSLRESSVTETLQRVEHDGTFRLIDDDLTLSNGLAWSEDGRTFFNVDTRRRIIFRRSYDPMTGATGHREEFLAIEGGDPDGIAMDSEGHLWVAVWGAGEVRRYTPVGELSSTIEVPAPNVSSIAFAGTGLDTLVITTATEDLTDTELEQFPLSGRVFTVKPGVTGFPLPLWNGALWPPAQEKEARMKLLRIGNPGAEKPAVLVDERSYVDVSDVIRDFDEEFFANDGIAKVRALVAERLERGEIDELDGTRIGAPIARPHQIVCVGLNYSDHASETGQEVPREPILFTKSPNTLVGPNDDVRIPRGSTKPDWEVELGIVIAKRTSYLESVEIAREHIAGWTLVNDISERAFQMERGGQWLKGKSAETFNPAGPYLVTCDEVPNVNALDMWLDVNGVRRQTGSTSTMIFDPYFIVHYVSQFLVLEPGDLINTGTPPGVGMGWRPEIWLQPGDVMQLGIEGLGTQQQQVIPPRMNPSTARKESH